MSRVSLAIELSGDLVRQIRAILPPGRTVETYIEDLLVGPVLTEHFVKLTAPEEYYWIADPVSTEEVDAARQSLDRTVEAALRSGQRKEAAAFGLMAAALDLCVRICREARYVRAAGHGQGLALEILDTVIDQQRRANYENQVL